MWPSPPVRGDNTTPYFACLGTWRGAGDDRLGHTQVQTDGSLKGIWCGLSVKVSADRGQHLDTSDQFALERVLQKQLIDPAHQRQVLRALPVGSVSYRHRPFATDQPHDVSPRASYLKVYSFRLPLTSRPTAAPIDSPTGGVHSPDAPRYETATESWSASRAGCRPQARHLSSGTALGWWSSMSRRSMAMQWTRTNRPVSD